MGTFFREITKIPRKMVMECTNLRMGLFIKENLEMIDLIIKDSFLLLTEINMREILRMGRRKALVSMCIVMGIYMMGNGIMDVKKARAGIPIM